jgi:hypothetical protein
MSELFRKAIEITRCLTWFEQQGYITPESHSEVWKLLMSSMKTVEPKPEQPKPFVEGLGEGWELATDSEYVVRLGDMVRGIEKHVWIKAKGLLGSKVGDANAFGWQVARKVS